jgi:hypothetical protein
MISGIYKLTFSSGKIYIGKSENIELRWQQHYASFVKNTHSKKMQYEYNLCGNPEYEIVLYVHPDHIDIYESIYIQQHWGPNCLNGNRPKPITPQDAQKYLEYYHSLTINDTGAMLHSSLMHLQAMEQYCKKLSELEHELELSQHDVLELETRGIKMPKDWQVLNDRLKAKNKQLHLDNTTHRSQINNYVQELSRLKNLSWWDRLWNYRVYV